MGEKALLFNKIATAYGLFFNWQVRKYRYIFDHAKEELDFSTDQSIIDIGCGTEALCNVLNGLNGLPKLYVFGGRAIITDRILVEINCPQK